MLADKFVCTVVRPVVLNDLPDKVVYEHTTSSQRHRVIVRWSRKHRTYGVWWQRRFEEAHEEPGAWKPAQLIGYDKDFYVADEQIARSFRLGLGIYQD